MKKILVLLVLLVTVNVTWAQERITHDVKVKMYRGFNISSQLMGRLTVYRGTVGWNVHLKVDGYHDDIKVEGLSYKRRDVMMKDSEFGDFLYVYNSKAWEVESSEKLSEVATGKKFKSMILSRQTGRGTFLITFE
jgi:hypothetical protein